VLKYNHYADARRFTHTHTHTKTRLAFTLVELLVVISIIALMSTIAVVATSSAQINARNTRRKADAVQISKALELYYADNSSYPNTGGAMENNCPGSGYSDTDPGSWIPGLTSGGYMAKLPRDPNTGKGNPNSVWPACQTLPTSNCYRYRSDGTNYKILIACTPEGTLSATDPFYDPARPTYSWQLTNNLAATSAW